MLKACSVPVADLEDVRQNLYLKLLESETSVLPENISVRWLTQICRRMAQDFVAKKETEIDHISFEQNRIETHDDESRVIPTLTDQQSMRTWVNEVTSNAPARISSGLELSKTFTVSAEHKVTAYMLIAHLAAGLGEAEIGEFYGVTKQAIDKWLKKWHKHVKQVLGSQYVDSDQ